MNTQNLQKVIDFLESESPGQTRGQLRSTDGDCFCILGACVEVWRREHGGEWSANYFKHPTAFAGGLLSEPIADYFGWSDTNPKIPCEIISEAGLDLFLHKTLRDWPDGKPVPLSFLNDRGLSWEGFIRLFETWIEHEESLASPESAS